MSRKNYELGFFGDPFFDDFDDFFALPKSYRRFENTAMKTDIQEVENSYVLKVDIPGAKKENISLKLNNGYLEISYTVSNENEDDKNHSRFLRKERYYGSMSRSFYVGDEYKEKDINATYTDGVLTIILPKLEEIKKANEPAKIEIK